jgi:glycosyltransferase involved in cell wall biosynthesis
MSDKEFNFESISLLVTHYNRSKSLERLLNSFQKLHCNFAEIIVSDDCSLPIHQENIKELQSKFHFRYISSPVNKGLGNNINKGQKLVKSPYTLYVQEDFVPNEFFPQVLLDSLTTIAKTKFDIIRFYSYGKYPYLKPYDKDFDEMQFDFWSPGYVKYYYYSDHPHLRRSDFFQKFGEYAEGQNPEQTEYRMMMNFLRNKGTGLFFRDFQKLFDHSNDNDEPSTMVKSGARKNWRRGKNPVIKIIRDVYRHVKFNYNYLTGY